MEIELENRECCGLQRLDLVGSGRSWVGLGAVVLGMEIELENKLWVSYGLGGCCSARSAAARNVRVWQSN